MWWIWLIGILVAAAIGFRIYMIPNSNPYRPDLTGKFAVVVGATAGIGVEMARILAQLGAKVTITGRDKAKAEKVLEELNKETNSKGEKVFPVEFIRCDLADLDQVAQFAGEVMRKIPHLDFLINNAATVPGKLCRTKQGMEMTIGTNYISLFYLTSLFFPHLKKSKEARIVNVSAGLYILADKLWSKLPNGEPDYQDILLDNLDPKDYWNMGAYGKSKLGNIFFTKSLAKKMEAAGINHIKTASHHPGVIGTDLSRDINPVLKAIGKIVKPLFAVSAWSGAQTAMIQCCCPFEKLFNGGFYSDCKPVKLSKIARDEESERLYWKKAVEKIKSLTNHHAFSEFN